MLCVRGLLYVACHVLSNGWLIGACYLLCVMFSRLFIVCGYMFDARCLLFVASHFEFVVWFGAVFCLMADVRGALFVACGLSSVVWVVLVPVVCCGLFGCLVFIICCLLFVVCCSFFVA